MNIIVLQTLKVNYGRVNAVRTEIPVKTTCFLVISTDCFLSVCLNNDTRLKMPGLSTMGVTLTTSFQKYFNILMALVGSVFFDKKE